MAGRPIFGTLIALLQDGWPLIGIIDQPISGERWVGATGEPTLFNGKPATTRACRSLADATLATTGPQYFSDHDGGHFMARSEEHTSELQSLMRSSYAVFCLKTKNH